MNQNLFLKQDYCFGIVTFENLFNLEIILSEDKHKASGNC